jgi:NAD(P)-dependent dehydrogenase (short-subunit alcohol dehydrogenase family)
MREFQAQAVLQSRAYRREELSEDVVGAVVFLAAEDSAVITGRTLVVDGDSVFL